MGSVAVLSSKELEEINGESESDLDEIIPPAIGKESTPEEGGTQKQKLDYVHDDLPSVDCLPSSKSKRKRSPRELNKNRSVTELMIKKDTWIAAEAQKPFCNNKFRPGVLKCSCLHVLQNSTLRLPVAKYCVEDVNSKSKTEGDHRVCNLVWVC